MPFVNLTLNVGKDRGEKEDMTPGRFIIVGTTLLLLFINWLVIFQNSRDPIVSFQHFLRQLARVATLGVFKNSLTAIAGGSKRKARLPFFAIDIEVVVLISYGCSAFRADCLVYARMFWGI